MKGRSGLNPFISLNASFFCSTGMRLAFVPEYCKLPAEGAVAQALQWEASCWRSLNRRQPPRSGACGSGPAWGWGLTVRPPTPTHPLQLFRHLNCCHLCRRDSRHCDCDKISKAQEANQLLQEESWRGIGILLHPKCLQPNSCRSFQTVTQQQM